MTYACMHTCIRCKLFFFGTHPPSVRRHTLESRGGSMLLHERRRTNDEERGENTNDNLKPRIPIPIIRGWGFGRNRRVLALSLTFIRVGLCPRQRLCLTSEEELQVISDVRCHVRLHLAFVAHSFLCPCSSSLFGEFSYASTFRFGVVLTLAWEKGFLCFASLCGFFSIQCTQLR